LQSPRTEIALKFSKYNRLPWAIQCVTAANRNQAGTGGVGERFCANIGGTERIVVRIYAGHVMNIVWVVIIGFIAGIIARLLAPGPNNPAGFILTTLLGIAGAFLATLIGQAVGWYRPDQGAGLIGAVVGALVVLFIWHRLVSARAIPDPGARRWL
jgi:uncharacterized membrane protein YeaQ/YmgE (transglycosylase-associated protein family)